MSKNSFGAVELSLLLLLGATPSVLLAHEGHDHRGQQGGYREREDPRRYDPQDEDDRWDEEDEEDDSYRSSSRRYPPPEWERSAPREERDWPRRH
jgi:hypothetical protein